MESVDVNFKSKVDWDKCTDAHKSMFKEELNKRLKNIPYEYAEFVVCNNYKCAIHNNDIIGYCKFIVKSIMLASDMCFPKTKKTKKILGWNEYIQPFLDKSLLWHDIWIQNGRPR